MGKSSGRHATPATPLGVTRTNSRPPARTDRARSLSPRIGGIHEAERVKELVDVLPDARQARRVNREKVDLAPDGEGVECDRLAARSVNLVLESGVPALRPGFRI